MYRSSGGGGGWELEVCEGQVAQRQHMYTLHGRLVYRIGCWHLSCCVANDEGAKIVVMTLFI